MAMYQKRKGRWERVSGGSGGSSAPYGYYADTKEELPNASDCPDGALAITDEDSSGSSSSSKGFITYSIAPTDSSGLVTINLSDLNHPTLSKPFNPIINLLSFSHYSYTLKSVSASSISIQLYNKDGQKQVTIPAGPQVGNTEVGTGELAAKDGDPDVIILISIPTSN